MMRSLYSAISGLKNHQIKMDVIGNNVANVNTIGFKKSSANFKDQLYQTVASASGPTNATGGTNAKQIGLGVTMGSIGTNHSQGNVQYTGATWDMCLSGEGYFTIFNTQGEQHYTRAGDFVLNELGQLVTAGGDYVKMVRARCDKTTGAYTPLKAEKNEDGTYSVNDQDTTTMNNVLTIPDGMFSSVSVTDAGAVVGIASRQLTQEDIDKLTPKMIDPPVPIPAGDSVVLGYVEVSMFANPEGLEKIGDNMFAVSDNSGSARRGVAGINGRGVVVPNSLEMSNVDLSEEMVAMIVTQRGFQANSRVITTSDTMLEELVNLKR